MNDKGKTKAALIGELDRLRKRLAQVEAVQGAGPPATQGIEGSETLFRVLAETVAAATFLFQGSNLLYVNSAAQTITGYSRDELLAMPFWGVIHPDFRDLVKERGQQRQAGADLVSNYEVKILTKDGKERWVDFTATVIEHEGRPAVLGTAFDITEHKRVIDVLHRRDAVLEAVSDAAARCLQTTDWREFIEGILERLGHAAQVSRIYVFENHPDVDGTLLTSRRFEWVAPGIEPQIENRDLQDLSWNDAGFARWMAVMREGKNICGDVRDFPRSEQPALVAQGIRSLLAVPIFAGADWWGLLGFDECRAERKWFPPEIDALRAAAGLIGSAIQRERAECARHEHEDRYRRLVETMRYGVQEIDSEGTILFANGPYHRMLGYEEVTLHGISILDLLAEDGERESLRAYLAQLVRDQPAPTPYFQKNRTKDGRILDVQVDWDYRRNDKGEVTGFVSVISDITERKRSEAALRQIEARQALILRTLPMALYTADVSGDYGPTWVSGQIKRLSGYPPERWLGEPGFWVSHLHPDDRERVTREHGRLLEDGETSTEYRWRRADGVYRWFLDRAVLVRDDEGNPKESIGTWLDITDRKEAEEALRQSERQYRQMFEVQADAVVLCSMEGVVLDMNRAACEIYGYTADEFRGLAVETLIHPDDHFDLRRAAERLARQEPFLTAGVNVRKDGSCFDVEVRLSPFLYDGRPHMLSVIRDVTERKAREIALKDSEQRYRAIVEDQTELICRWLPDGRLTFVNEAYCHYFGKKSEELLGAAFMPLIIPPEDRAAVERHIATLSAENPVATHEHRVINASGEVRWQRWTNHAILDDSAHIVEFQSVGRDVTERRQAERQLVEYRDHLEKLVWERTHELEASREKLRHSERLASIGTLASGVAHEINNPIGGILLGAQHAQKLRQKGASDDHMDACLSDIITNAERCGAIIRSVLQFARKGDAQKWPNSLNGVIEYSVANTSAYVSECGGATEPKLADDLPWVNANPLEMEQVFINLIRNAAEAGGQGVTITVRTEKTAEHVRVIVEDDGPGIPRRDVKHVFDPFFSTRKERGGTGLGLSIVHGIITDHGGTIQVRNRRGGGARFVIELPIAETPEEGQ